MSQHPVGSGDTAFDRLYRAHRAAVVTYVRRRASADDADDVVAEVFTVAWRRGHDLPEVDAALPWLCGVARRVIANGRRSQLRRQRLYERVARLDQQGSSRADVVGELVGEALGRLPAAQRDTLRLIFWEGWDTRELSLVWGCSANAAAVRIHRARKRLGAELASLHGQAPGPQPKDRSGNEAWACDHAMDA